LNTFEGLNKFYVFNDSNFEESKSFSLNDIDKTMWIFLPKQDYPSKVLLYRMVIM